ncbi:hypothetical protein EV424DRAFT_1429845 [Suillus variegatus]|nr:hypothetical protein EV424DRAFT_1429845 [Suillus variegatus]
MVLARLQLMDRLFQSCSWDFWISLFETKTINGQWSWTESTDNVGIFLTGNHPMSRWVVLMQVPSLTRSSETHVVRFRSLLSFSSLSVL